MVIIKGKRFFSNMYLLDYNQDNDKTYIINTFIKELVVNDIFVTDDLNRLLSAHQYVNVINKDHNIYLLEIKEFAN